MNAQKLTIGFDRKIHIAWLDAIAADVKAHQSLREARENLSTRLSEELSGEGTHSAKGKTITVLLRIWAIPTAQHVALRDAAVQFLDEMTTRERIWLHWGLALVTYPFFRDVAIATGRLLALQGHVALSQLSRRMQEVWGQRSTLVRAVQRVARSFIEWGVLVETNEKGIYKAAPRRGTREILVQAWLVEAALRASGTQMVAFRQICESPALFPFTMTIQSYELGGNPRLDMVRQGLDEDLVAVKDAPRKL
jgi:hypothetical protein